MKRNGFFHIVIACFMLVGPGILSTAMARPSTNLPTAEATQVHASSWTTKPDTASEAALWRQRVQPIVAGCTTDYQKARAIYDWVCQNIAYDMADHISDANTCWNQKRGICSGYSQLYIKLAHGCGLQAEEINGMAKTITQTNGKGPHAWVKVKTEKGWTLLDATWGAGEVVTDRSGAKQFKRQFRSFWFDINPQWNIFTHFPKRPEDQLLPSPITQEQYHRLPVLWPSVEAWGLEADKMLSHCLAHKDAKMPKTYDVPKPIVGKMKLIAFPLKRTLLPGKSYQLEVECADENYRPFLQPNTEWEKKGNKYTATIRPTSKQKYVRLEIGEPDGNGGWKIYTLLEYTVKAK